MKKATIFTMLIVGAVMASGSLGFAQDADSKSFILSATVPNATAFSIDAFVSINGGPQQPVTGTTLNFGTLAYNSQFGIYRSDRDFRIQVASSNGAGNPNVSVRYTGNSVPPGQIRPGLTHKSVITFNKVLGNTETQLANHPRKILNALNESISANEFNPGEYLKMYLGITDGGTGEPTGAQPFTNLDRPGTYSGTLIVTVVVS